MQIFIRFLFILLIITRFETSLGHSPDEFPGLGFAYNSLKGKFLSRVLEPDPNEETQYLFHGSETGDYTFDYDLGYQNILEKLGISTDGSYKSSMYDFESKASYAAEMAANDYSSNLLYQYHSHGIRARLTHAVISTIIRNGLKNASDPKFPDMLGDKVVLSIGLYLRLTVTAKIQFQNQEAKNKISGKFGIKFSQLFSGDFDSKFNQAIENSGAKITMKAFQEGGDTSGLFDIISGSDGSSKLLACASEDVGKCQEVFNSLIKYGSKFKGQLTNGIRSHDQSGFSAAKSGYMLASYSEAGFTNLALNDIDETHVAEIEKKRQFLRSEYLRLREQLEIIRSFQIFSVDEDDLENLNKAQRMTETAIRYTLELLDLSAEIAPDEFLEKISNYSKVEWESKDYRPKWVFKNYCRHSTESGVKNLIQRLAAEVSSGEPNCTLIEKSLNNYRTLDLSFNPKLGLAKITDISPLRQFQNLREINLSGNDLVSIDELNQLPKLERILARQNNLQHFPILDQLKNLVVLDISQNSFMRIHKSDIRNFQGHSKLKFLSTRGNSLGYEVSKSEELVNILIEANQLDIKSTNLGFGIFFTDKDNLQGHISSFSHSIGEKWKKKLYEQNCIPILNPFVPMIPIFYSVPDLGKLEYPKLFQKYVKWTNQS